MSADFRQLMSKPVIRLEDVSALRAHIEQRHPDLASHLRAEMLAEGINRMIDSAMTGLDISQRESIKKKLISDHLIGNRQSVLKLDLLNHIMELDVRPDQLIAKTWGWYVLNTGHSVTLTDFIEQASPYLPHRVRDAIKDAELRNLAYHPSGRYLDSETVPKMQEEAVSDATKAAAVPPWRPVLPEGFKTLWGRITAYRLTRKGQLALAGAVGVLILGASLPQIISMLSETAPVGGQTSSLFAPPLEYRPAKPGPYITQLQLDKPAYLRYQNISLEKLKTYLDRKDSMLLTKDYLDQLMNYSLEKDLNPLLLIAIIGQEQNYVPSQHRFAPRMIENPFNIYGSWETHPVGFTASMKEACYTINTALGTRTLYADPFATINNRYAEDPRWHLGVKVIFRDLMALAGE